MNMINEKIVTIKEIDLPCPQKHVNRPVFTEKTYKKRIDRLKKIMIQRNLEHIIIYGDMANFANIYYLTGIIMKFEQALLIINKSGKPVFISGNEMIIFCKSSPLKDIELLLFQPFSLQGQPHSKSINLDILLKEAGIKKGESTGIICNKYYPYYRDYEKIYDIPHYIMEIIAGITERSNLINCTQLMTDPVFGMRNNLDIEDIAFLEFSSGLISGGIYNILKNLETGMNEVEASSLFGYRGELPFFVPWGIEFGYETLTEIGFPDEASILKKGDKVVIGTAIWGSCMARSGIFVSNRKELELLYPGIIKNFYFPYFRSIANWYNTLRIGINGGELYKSVADFIENPLYGVSLNPGHLIHYDEWTNSPVYKFSRDMFHSGIAIQCDYFSHHIQYGTDLILEDGLVLADEKLKTELNKKYPALMKRVENRRKFMTGVLGIELDRSILPLNDLQAVLMPFMLDIMSVLTIEI